MSRMKIFESLTQYLLSLKPAQLQEIYNEPAACLVVFRDLPDLAKHFILRLLFIEQPIHQSLIGSCVTKNAIAEHDAAVKVIKDMRLWTETSAGLPGWILDERFRKGLQTAFVGGGEAWPVEPAVVSEPKHAKDIPFLDSYATERWEMLLHYMVGSKQLSAAREKISNVAIATLVTGKLISLSDASSSNSDPAPLITADGFQFLLMDTSSQVWFFLTKYLERVESGGLEKCPKLSNCLSLIFQLSFCRLGRIYSSEKFTPEQLEVLQHLREFGLIFIRKRSDKKFYTTRLLVNLFAGLRDKQKDASKEGFVIIETNYRVYAYTDSALQIALLAIFTQMNYRFPGFCLGMLTRESVRSALRSGITAAQIINFLNVNTHPSVREKSKTPVPPSITDQIRLWEKERDRYTVKESYLYSQFLSHNEFEVLRNYARDSGHLIWENPQKRSVVVSVEGHDDVRLFWKRYKKEHRKELNA